MKVELETPEVQEPITQPETDKDREAVEDAADQAHEETQEAQEASKEAAEASKEATQAASQATRAEDETKAMISSLKSEIDGLVRLTQTQNQRVENLEALLKSREESLSETEAELRQTMELWQDQIGQIDAAAGQVVDAAAALVKLHKVQTETK